MDNVKKKTLPTGAAALAAIIFILKAENADKLR